MPPILTHRRTWGVAAVCAAMLAFFTWFAASSVTRPAVIAPAGSAIATGSDSDLYALLARGFLRGRLGLDAEAPAPLAAASDPYDPEARSVPYLHDASLYRGRYYLYFGPAPAALLFLPFRLITRHDLPSAAAVAVFCLLGYAGLIALFAAAAGPGFGWKPFPLAAAIAVGLGAASFYLPLLRRAAVYEVAIAAGSAFFLWAFVFLFRRPRGWSALAGLLLGLAFASRPTYALCLAPLAAAILALPGGGTRRERLRALASAGAAFGAVAALILLYNALRFGNPAEFGQSYQLSGAREGALHHFSASHLPFQAREYLFSPLRVGRYYPFLHADPPAVLPPGIGGYEYAFGLFASLPVALFALVAVAAALRPSWPGRGPALVLAGAGVATLLPPLLYFGCCVRYMADFAPVLAVLAGLGMAAAAGWAGRRGPRQGAVMTGLAGAAALASLAVAFFAGVDMYDHSADTPPPAFDRLGQFFDGPARAWDRAHGIDYGPRRLRLAYPRESGQSASVIRAESASGHWDEVRVERADEEHVRFLFLRDGPAPVEHSALIPIANDSEHDLVVSMGALLPLRPGELPATAERRPSFSRAELASLRHWLHVAADGRTVWEVPVYPRQERFERIAAGGRAEVLPPAAIGLPAPARAGVRLRLDLTPAMAGRSFPLASTGQDGAGNILLVAVGSDGTVRFGYDQWGKPTLWSGRIPAVSGRHRVNFWMPSILGGDAPSPLSVAWDGRVAWQADVPFYAAGGHDIYLGRNPLGGTTCEAALINASFSR